MNLSKQKLIFLLRDFSSKYFFISVSYFFINSLTVLNQLSGFCHFYSTMFLKLVSNSSTYEQGNWTRIYFSKSIYLKHQSNLSFLLSFHFLLSAFFIIFFEFFQVVLISLLGSSFLFFFFNIIFLVVVWWLSWICGLVFEEELPEPYHCLSSFFLNIIILSSWYGFGFDLSWFLWD